MRNVRLFSLVALLALMLSGLLTLSTPASAHASTNNASGTLAIQNYAVPGAKAIGGLQLYNACVTVAQRTNNNSFGYNMGLISQSAYGWRCKWAYTVYIPFAPIPFVGFNYRNFGLNEMNQACLDTYGVGAYAKSTDTKSPYSWVCYR